MLRSKMFLTIILNLYIITILMIPTNAGVLTTKKMIFFISETSTKVSRRNIKRIWIMKGNQEMRKKF